MRSTSSYFPLPRRTYFLLPCESWYAINFFFFRIFGLFKGDSDSYSNANLEVDQTFSIKKEKDNSDDGIKSFELCSNSHHFPGNYLIMHIGLCYREKIEFIQNLLAVYCCKRRHQYNISINQSHIVCICAKWQIHSNIKFYFMPRKRT